MWKALELQFSRLNQVLLRILVVACRFIILYYSCLYSAGSLSPCRCQQLSFVAVSFSLEFIFRGIGDIWGALSLQFLTLIIFWTRIFLCEMTQSWDSGVSISSLKLSYRFRAAPLSWMLGHGQPGGEGEKSLLSAQPFDSHCFSPLVVAIAISERQLHQT